jgi:chemotaxis protein CheD
MAQIAPGSSSLTAFAGSDFVVALCGEGGGDRGGLISFVFEAAGQPLDAAAVKRLDGFSRALRPACAALRLRATIAGGANILGTVPARQWNAWATATAGVLASALEASQAVVARTEVGGSATRFVTLDPGRGHVQIDALHRRSRTETSRRPSPVRDAERKACDWNVDMGAAQVQRAPDRLVAVLGSCVGIALFDPVTRIGGLAHAVLPAAAADRTTPLRYVDTAVPALIAQLAREGTPPHRLQAKLAGGANALPGGTSYFQTGYENVLAARESLQRAGIPILAEHVGGRTGRKIVVDLRSFRVSVAWLAGGSTA